MRTVAGWMILLFTSSLPAVAQEFRSTVTGRVIDAQQSVVPGVKVVCTNAETGVKYETVSGGDGAYAVPFLPPGKYALSASATGFKTYERKSIELTANQRLQLDVVLEVGSVNETLTVTSEAPALEAATASTGQVIDSRQMDLLPLNGRTPLVLARLTNGVIASGIPLFVRPFDNGNSSGFSIGGTATGSNELLLDGAPNIGSAGTVAYNPPMDAVTEVKVESFQADAAQGHTGGGSVNVLLKSGTNSPHGSAYEYNQNTALAANPWFENAADQKNPSSPYDQWGATLGGPIFVPKVYDGRNKVFFFFAYEGVTNTLPRPQAATVPTDAERSGDFSALLKLGSQYQIYDPSTGVVQGSRIQRSPFPGNIIPTYRINSISQALMPFLPSPNNFTAADGTNDYLSNQAELDTFRSELTRVDFNFSNRNKFYANIRNNLRKVSLDLFHNPSTNYYQQRINWGGMVEDVLTLSATTVLDIRANYTRYALPTVSGSNGYDITKLGFPSSLAAASQPGKLPSISFSTITAFGTVGNSGTANESYQIFPTLTKVVGNHSLKAGADMRLYRNSSNSLGSGTYTFGTNWTVGPLDNSTSAPIGQDFAGFLLGLPTSGSFPVNASNIYQAGYYSVFVQDDFRVRPDLTLNPGLRYERDLPTTERYNRSVNGFDTTTPSPISAAAVAAYSRNPIPQLPASAFRVNGGLLFADANDRSVYQTRANSFSPRIGFAWKPKVLGEKTVVRGGFGIFYFPIGATGINQEGFSANNSLVATNNGYLTPNLTLSNPFPSGIAQPVGSSQGLGTFMGQSITFNNPHPLNPYTLRWTLNLQRSLPGRITMQLGYEGDHSLHLVDSESLDYTPAQYLSQSPFRDQTTINNLSSNVTNPFSGLLPGTTINGTTIGLSSLLTAYPQFTGVTETGMNEGSSYFHQGTASLDKRFSAGLTLLVNYQFSKMLTRLARLNSSDLQLAKQVAADDRPQRLVVSANYELPVGRGKRFLPSAPAVVNGIVGGWIVNGIYTQQSGPVLTWGNVLYFGGDLQLNPRAVSGAFNVNLFDRKSADQLSSNIRTFPLTFGDLRGDAPNNIDFSAIKQFPIHERLRLEYRCEWFNAFNHAVFSNPSTSPTSSAFATITSVSNLSRVIQMSLRLAW